MISISTRFRIVLALIILVAPATAQNKDDKEGLKDYYKKYFAIGVAVRPSDVNGPESQLILKHFNSLTAENVMKPGPIHPEENRYNWEPADQIVNFAQANGLKMRGHTLCWHNQTAPWFFKDAKGDTASKELVLQRLKDHITAVVTRYKGKIYAWDVVNEVIADGDGSYSGGARVYRNSIWYKICGEDFIKKAFEYAHAADPDAILFYNDYNTETAAKRDKIYEMLKKFIAAGVPIHAVGLQGHWSVANPSKEELAESINKFASLGLKVQITELDVSVYTPEPGGRREKKEGEGIFTPELEQKQIDQYKMIFSVLRDNKKSLTGVTFWNLSDKSTWLDNFPVRGRKNFPLLFDANLQPKKVYWEVVKF